MASTYTPIATQTIGSSTSYIDFTSIPQTYTDLILQVTTFATSGDQPSGVFRVGNGSIDGGSNYSVTNMYGNGTTAGSTRSSSQSYAFWNPIGISASTSVPNTSTLHFQNYSNTTTYKTILGRADSASFDTVATVNLWRSTSAINCIRVWNYPGYNMGAGSTFTLYGILSA